MIYIMKYIDKKKFFILIIILLLIINLFMLVSPAIIIKTQEDNKVLNVNIYNEVLQCTEKYINSILNEDKNSVNSKNVITNMKNDNQIEDLKSKLNYLNEQDVIIKEIYEFDKNVYKCYFLKNIKNETFKIYEDTKKSDMNYIVIRLYPEREEFKIIDIKV